MSRARVRRCAAQWRWWLPLLLLGAAEHGMAAANDPLKLLTYPTNPIKVVVPWPVQSDADLLARSLVERLEATLKQRMHIENRPGTGGNLGADLVARAAADGYTLLLTAADTLVINPHLPDLRTPFAGITAFEPIALIAHADVALVAHAAVKATSVGQLIAYAHANPGKVSFGTSGPGTRGHVLTTLLQQRTGIQITTVPTQGDAAAATAVAGGVVHAAFGGYSVMEPYLRSKQITLLALPSRHKAAAGVHPDSPIAEFELSLYFGLFAPSKTPLEIVERLNLHINRAVEASAVRARLAKRGFETDPDSPAAFRRMLEVDHQRWSHALSPLKPEPR